VFDTGGVPGTATAVEPIDPDDADSSDADSTNDDSTNDVVSGLDRTAKLDRLQELVERTRPVSLSHERTLPVLSALEPLLPYRGLQRGSVLRISGGSGATSLALAALAGPTRAGSWVACTGVPGLGWSAASEVGVQLDHVVAVRASERSWVTVMAALVDAFDVVLCGPEHRPTPAQERRLMARARERESVVISIGDPIERTARQPAWSDADVVWSVGPSVWSGTGLGWGHLASRRVSVTAGGRRSMSRDRRVDLWLPGPNGVTIVDPADVDGAIPGASDVVVPFRRDRAG